MKKIIISILFSIAVTFILTGCASNDKSNYFEVLDLEYNGPKLEDKYFEITDLFTERNGEKYGTGIAFEVTLISSVDGDTGWFNLPNDYSTYYTSSFRYLNMDTEETRKEKEEWGMPGSNYSKSLLTNAYSIALQNDPGENLTDHYDRGLAWIWVKTDENSEYELLNYKVLQQGLGSVAYLYGAGGMIHDGKTYTEWMYQAENEAKTNKRGMHSSLKDPYWDYENNTALFSLFN